MKKYIFILIASMMATAAMAQELTEQQQRLFRRKAYETLTQYVESHSLSDDERKEAFISLFPDPSMEIYNDLLGLTVGSVLSVDEYVSTLSNNAKQIEVQVKNVTKGSPFINGSIWQMPITFDKRIAYTNNIGVRLDSYEYYDTNYKITMQLVMNPATGKCHIGSMEGEIASDRRPLTGTYTVLMRQSDQDDRFTVKGRRVAFNNRGQMIVPGTISKSDMTYDGADDFRLRTERNDDSNVRKVYVEYVPKPFRVKLHGSFALGDFYSLEDPLAGITTPNNNSEMNFGIDFGYVFLNKKNLSIGLFAGVGISKSSLKLEGSIPDYSYPAKGEVADMDYDETEMQDYERYYQGIGTLSQGLDITDITIPVYLDMEYHFSRILSAYLDLGIKPYLNINNSWSAEKATIGNIYGVYKHYNDLSLPANGEELGLNGFGQNKHVDNVNTSNFQIKSGIAILPGLGLRFNFMKQLGAELGIQYQTGITRWENEDEPTTKLIKYTVIDGEQMSPLLNATKGLKHNSALRLHIGIIYKF